MKRIFTSLVLVFLLIGMIPKLAIAKTEVFINTPEQEPLRVGFFSFDGFHNIGSSGELSGYGYDYLQEIAQYTGWHYEYVYAPWDECLKMLERGEIDLLGSVQKTPDREKLYDFSDLQSGVSTAILCTNEHNTSIAYEDFQAFNNMSVGLLQGSSRNLSFQNYCESNDFTVNTHIYRTEKELTDALKSGSIDSILTSDLRKTSDERIIARFAPSPFYFATAKGNEKVLSGLNYAQNIIKNTNPYFDQQLYQKYYGSLTEASLVMTREEQNTVNNAPVIRVAVVDFYQPFICYDPLSDTYSGIISDILNDISIRTGLTFRYKTAASFKDALDMVKNQNADITGFFSKNYYQAEQNNLRLTSSYLNVPAVMITDKKVPVPSYETLALTSSYLLPYEALSKLSSGNLAYYDTPEDCAEAVKNHKADAAFLNAYSADYILSDSRFFDLKQVSLKGYDYDMCFAVSDNMDALLFQIINQAVTSISKDKMNEIIIDNNLVFSEITIQDIFNRMPLNVVLLAGGIFIIITCALGSVIYMKSRNNRIIHQLLDTDTLTGMSSYKLFLANANSMLEHTAKQYALISLDIDRFKYINETYGYQEGDRLLITLAGEIRNFMGEGELFARVFADNYILLLTYSTRPELHNRILSINQQLDLILNNNSRGYHLVLSLGIYCPGQEPLNLDVFIDRASYAREQAKGSYSNTIMYYDEQIKKQIKEEKELESQMKSALSNREFKPYYQAKVDITSREIVGAEALVRWINPRKGFMSPGSFIPYFEKCGFIVNVDLYIFKEVCCQIRQWLNDGIPVPTISCNFSRLHFKNENFPETLKQIADECQVPASLLELEITETVAMEHAEVVSEYVDRLHSYGFKIAIDDFGVGYSSLGVLEQLSIDVLKLDKTFFDKSRNNKISEAIIQCLVDLANKIQMQIVCEGIETTEQEQFLHDTGCYIAQGFLYARPIPAEEFRKEL